MRRYLAIAVLVLLSLWGLGEWAIRSASWPSGLGDTPPETPVLTDRKGRAFFVQANEFARECRPRPLRDMGAWLPLATVGIEDHRFWQHAGMDLRAVAGAAVRNLKSRRVLSGGSTISQQLIKLASQRKGQSFSVKLPEALSALKLERNWSKEKILETYVNRLDYGNRRIGPEAAARAYFGKSVRDVTLSEAIFLAGLPQSPTRLNPWKNPDAAMARYRRNVARLSALNLLPEGISEEQLLERPPKIERHDPLAEAIHFASLVPARSSTTTLDLDLQRAVEHMLRAHLAATNPFGVRDSAVVVLDNQTGEVRALACAGEARHLSINSAIEPRSCGSTLKPFLYLAALDQRTLTAATVLPDTAEAISGEYRDYDPQNYSKRYFGPVRVREALGNSMNVPAVVALSRLGARDTFAGLHRWGLNFPRGFDAYGAGFILGNAPVRLLELAGAYASIARGGTAWSPKFLPQGAVESSQAGSSEASAIITDILCDNEARLLSFGSSSPLQLGVRVAVKTGTSSGFRDGWCVGYNKTHTVAVWAGNLDGQPMSEILAVRSAAPLWGVIMRGLLAQGDEPLPELRTDEKLKSVRVAAETGFLPRTNEKAVQEWFLAGTEPHDQSDSWYVNGVLRLPIEYAAWCAGPHNRLGAVVQSDELKVLFPRDGAVFEANPHLPKNQQVLKPVATQQDCAWTINDGPRLTSDEAKAFPLQKGEWTVRAFKNGAVAEARFSVE